MQTQQKKQKGIIFVFSNQLVYYADHLPQALSFPFKPEVIQHLDVINRELLISQIKTFVKTNRLVPSLLSIVAHDSVLFQKTFALQLKIQPGAHQLNQQKPVMPTPESPLPDSSNPGQHPLGTITFPLHLPVSEEKKSHDEFAEDQQKEIDTFIESVPFEDFATKVIKGTQGQTVFVGNKDLFLSIKEAFEVAGFSTDGVYPFPLFKDISLVQGITPQICLGLISKIDTMKQESMQLAAQPIDMEPENTAGKPGKPKTDKKRMIIMVSVFAILIIFMILFYLKTDSDNRKLMKQKFVPLVSQVALPTASPTIEVASLSADQTLSPQIVTIQLLTSSASATLGNQLRAVLFQAGYKNITISQQGSVTPGRVFVLFTPRVPLLMRESILAESKKVSATVSSQESATIESDVVITL